MPMTYLFVPATRLERISKAVESGADAAIIDLEDAVLGQDKHALRNDVFNFLKAWDFKTFNQLYFRINGAETDDFNDDIHLIKQLFENNLPLAGIILPKVNTADNVAKLVKSLDDISLNIIAMIESASGVLNIDNIAKVKGVSALSYGCLDLLTLLGVQVGTASAEIMLNRIRTDLILHSVANGLNPPIETIYPDFKNDVGLANNVQLWHGLGFGGQLLIHPRQVPIVKQFIAPKDEQLNFAQQIMEIYQTTGQAVFQVNGVMVDMPLIEWARKVQLSILDC